MRVFAASALVTGFVTAWAVGADRKDQLFVSWQEAQRGIKSLVVEFTQETRDLSFEQRRKAEGTFRLIRTPTGQVFASCDLTSVEATGEAPKRCSGLLNGGAVYLLDHDNKSAIRFKPAGDDLQGFLEQYFNPFVLLLDRDRADRKCQVQVTKQDVWYTYLTVKPNHVKRSGWFPDNFREGRVILMNKASDTVPKDMPRQLWYTNDAQECTIDIKAWRFNAEGAPKLEEFTKPEDRPGWEVVGSPFAGKE